VCTFSDPRGFDDFSGESNNHKKKEKEKERERIPRDAVIVGALVGPHRISNSASSNGTRRDWNIRHMWARKKTKQDSTWTSTRIATDVDRLIEFVNFFCFFVARIIGSVHIPPFFFVGFGTLNGISSTRSRKKKKKENGTVLFIQSYQKLRCIWRVMYKTAGAGVCVWAGDLNAASGHQP
jgi:hypothetical protein